MSFRKTACPQCAGHIEFPTEAAGEPIGCPHCQHPFLLPRSRPAWMRPVLLVSGLLLLCFLGMAGLARLSKPQMDRLAEFIANAVLVGLAVAVYFAPTLNARNVHHRQTIAIFLLNLLLGWTVLGWIGALVWSAVREK